MKVVHINICGNLSTGNIASDIIRIVNAKGGEGIIAYARGKGYDDIKSIQIGTKWNVYMHALMSRLTDRTGFYSKYATKCLVERLQAEDPDIIHLHNIHGYYLHVGVLFEYLKKCGKPIVWTQHDCWAFTGHCPYFSAVGCNRYLKGCYACPQKREYPASWLMDQSARNYRDKQLLFTGVPNMTLVTPSIWLKQIIGHSFLQDYDCRVIQNGVDPQKFYPRSDNGFRKKYHLEKKRIVLGVASAWSPRKGYADFLKLASLVDENVKIVMVGLYKEQIAQLPKQILGLERTTSVEELAQIYTEADIYFNASVEETMGLTTMEAILCGTPVVVYDATAVPECVTKKNGYIVAPHDVEAVANLVNSDVWKNFIEPLEYDDRYIKDNAYEKYYELYQELLERTQTE